MSSGLRWLGSHSLISRISFWPNGLRESTRRFKTTGKESKSTLELFVKVGGNNIRGQMRREKTTLIEEIKLLDAAAEISNLTATEWNERYEKERALEQIYSFEEIQWQKRGGEKWLLHGDANTGFFHNKANGRKKKCTIFSLEDGDRTITRDRDLREHIEDYYKTLFGPEKPGGISVEDDFWSS
jgi:hypothetical protein